MREEVVLSTASRRTDLGLPGAYPVPFGEQLTVPLSPTPAVPATLVLLDALGREVRRETLTLRRGLQQPVLATRSLAAGLYPLRLLTAAGSQQVKVVK